MSMKRLVLAVLILGLVGFVGHRVLISKPSEERQSSSSGRGVPHRFSLTDANSQWVIVNKDKPLNPERYSPFLALPQVPIRGSITDDEKQVAQLITPALGNMFAAAKEQGVQLDLQSGYRSYDLQKRLYGSYTSQDDQAAIDNFSAKPSYSEHQTGLAVDVGGSSNPECNVKPCFKSTAESKWLADNAHTYGFIIRYPEDKQQITGYSYEPWHLRYVGIYLATSMKSKNTATLEEYFKL